MSKLKYLKLLIFVMIIFFIPDVFASNTNVASKVRYNPDTPKGTYKGDEIYLGGYNGRFTIGTRYNGRLGMLSFYLSADDYNFTINHTYTITLNMATEDWRNHFMGPQVIEANSSGTLGSSLSTSNFRFVSYKQIKFNFKTDGSLPSYYFFRLYSTDYANPSGGNTAITGTNNWNLSSIYINNNVSATPTPAPVTPAPTPTPQPSNKDIIDNAKQNTQDIINNQNDNTNNLIENNNQNTTDIIENNNQNTDRIVDSIDNGLNECRDSNNIFYADLPHLVYNNATLQGTPDNFVIAEPFNNYGNIAYSLGLITNPKIYRYMSSAFVNNSLILAVTNSSIYSSWSDFSSDRTIITSSWSSNSFDLSNYQNKYLWIMMRGSFPPDYGAVNYKNFILSWSPVNSYEPYGKKICKSKLDDTTNAINGVNNTLQDETTPDITLDLELNSNSPVSDLLTMPITLLNKVFDLSDDTCTPYVLPFDFSGGNNTLTLPCIDLKNYLGNSVYNILDTILCFYFAYEIGMMCISIYEGITSLKDSFYSMYTPEHAKPIGKHTSEVE